MQFLYGRDKSDYKTLSKSKNLSDSAASVLIKDYLGYEFVQNQAEYSDVSKEPVSIAYSVTSLDGYLNEEVIVVSKSGRYVNYTTPSRYSHAKLFEIEENSFKKGFFDFFKYSFVESVETENYKDDEIDDFKGEEVELKKTVPLSKDSLKAVLYNLFDNYRDISKKVYLMLDVAGDEYNDRSIDVIRQIYENIPYFMRRSMGFVSYGTFNQNYSSRVKLIVMPKSNSEANKNLVMDLSNIDFANVKKQASLESQLAVDYILGLTEDKKDEFFEELSNDPNIYKKTVLDLSNICKSKQTWGDKDDIGKMSAWIYNIINCNELEDAVFNIMLDDIESELNSKMYNDYLKHILSKVESVKLDYLKEDTELYQLLLFEDILSVDYKNDLKVDIEIDNEYIGNWWKANIIPLIRKDLKGAELLSSIENEIKKYEALDFQGESFNSLKSYIKREIDNIIAAESVDLESDISGEAEQILYDVIHKIQVIEDFKGMVSNFELVKEKLDLLSYSKNKNDLKEAYARKFKNIVKADLENNKVDDIFREASSFLEANKQYLLDGLDEYVQQEIEAKKNEIANSMKYKSIETLGELYDLQRRYLVENDITRNEFSENILVSSLKSIIDKMSIDEINDRENRKYAENIFRCLEYKNLLDDYSLIDLLISKVKNRVIRLDLHNMDNTIAFIKEMKLLVDDLLSDEEKNLYEFEVEYSEEEFYVKYMYIDALVEYIQEQSKKSIFKKIKNIVNKKSEFYKENEEILNSLDEILK